MMLTRAQAARLDRLPGDVKVVGTDQECPLVERKGRIVRVAPHGKLVPARKDVVEVLNRRRRP